MILCCWRWLMRSKSSKPPDLFENWFTAPKWTWKFRKHLELPRWCVPPLMISNNIAYYVASVVGLVCIRIFGYEDKKAEFLAEDCGLAFQLTNIVRDVKEDAAMGRVYIPEEDLARAGLSAANFECAA